MTARDTQALRRVVPLLDRMPRWRFAPWFFMAPFLPAPIAPYCFIGWLGRQAGLTPWIAVLLRHTIRSTLDDQVAAHYGLSVDDLCDLYVASERGYRGGLAYLHEVAS